MNTADWILCECVLLQGTHGAPISSPTRLRTDEGRPVRYAARFGQQLLVHKDDLRLLPPNLFRPVAATPAPIIPEPELEELPIVPDAVIEEETETGEGETIEAPKKRRPPRKRAEVLPETLYDDTI